MDKLVKVKLTGKYEDVLATTKRIESVFGIENIHQMSGILPANEGLSLRYIDLLPVPAEAVVLDTNNNKVKGNLFDFMSKGKGAHNG